jgi:hypothetical protein
MNIFLAAEKKLNMQETIFMPGPKDTKFLQKEY